MSEENFIEKIVFDKEEKEIVNGIRHHINDVYSIINILSKELIKKAEFHDESKALAPEFYMFKDFLTQIKKYKFGSNEYNEFVKNDAYCFHHFECNDHHPEHFKNGVHDMNLVNITEMFADWISSSIKRSNCSKRDEMVENIIKLCEKFKIDILLTQILVNTVDFVITRLQLNKMR